MGPAAGFLLLGAGVVAVVLAASKAGGASSSSPAPAGTGTTAAAQGGATVVGLVTWADLQAVAAMHGWDQAEVQAWANVVKSESNGTLTDTNKSSGAYGIAQGITGPSWYYDHGGNPNSVMGQLTAMANYIAQRYKTPTAAWSFHQANNWY